MGMRLVVGLLPEEDQGRAVVDQLAQGRPRRVQFVNVDAIGQVRPAELRPQVVRLDVVLDEQGHHVTRRFGHPRFELAQPDAWIDTPVRARTDGTVVAAVAEAHLVHQRVVAVEVVRVEHEGPHAGVPLRVKPAAVVAGWVEDAVRVRGEGVVRFREGHFVIGTVAQDLHPVAFPFRAFRQDRRVLRGEHAPRHRHQQQRHEGGEGPPCGVHRASKQHGSSSSLSNTDVPYEIILPQLVQRTLLRYNPQGTEWWKKWLRFQSNTRNRYRQEQEM